jgi:hypothetical protein
MHTTQQGIETFLGVIPPCKEHDEVMETIKQLRHTKSYKCPSAKMYALHLIFDLYGEDSSREANVNRITINLEAAADQLNHLSKLIKERARVQEMPVQNSLTV